MGLATTRVEVWVGTSVGVSVVSGVRSDGDICFVVRLGPGVWRVVLSYDLPEFNASRAQATRV
jgi:hypothetical protein